MKYIENPTLKSTVSPPKITNRPYLSAPERICHCGRSYRYPWAWAITLPEMTLIDLCAYCSRILRYGDEDQRRELAAMITRREAAI